MSVLDSLFNKTERDKAGRAGMGYQSLHETNDGPYSMATGEIHSNLKRLCGDPS